MLLVTNKEVENRSFLVFFTGEFLVVFRGFEICISGFYRQKIFRDYWRFCRVLDGCFVRELRCIWGIW